MSFKLFTVHCIVLCPLYYRQYTLHIHIDYGLIALYTLKIMYMFSVSTKSRFFSPTPLINNDNKVNKRKHNTLNSHDLIRCCSFVVQFICRMHTKTTHRVITYYTVDSYFLYVESVLLLLLSSSLLILLNKEHE